MSQRKAKVEHALRDVLSELIRREVRDPRVQRVGLLSVTKVELNVDLSVAQVYVSLIGSGGAASAGATPARAKAATAGVIDALNRAARFLRGPAGRALNLAHPPELRFALDESAEMHERLRAVVLEDEARARAAGREQTGGAEMERQRLAAERARVRALEEEAADDAALAQGGDE
jgi:ribosome-binding factor A